MAILGAFSKVTLDNFIESSIDDQMVIQAFRRYKNDFSDASLEEIGAYLGGMHDNQIEGVVNNVKGILHEMEFVRMENEDGDSITAALYPETNHPGYDVVMFDDSDDTAIQLLELMKNTYPDLSICFCNGGDRKEDNIPEINETGVTFAFNMGNKKTTSSRALFNRVKFEPKAKRWGEFRVVYSDSNIKIKLLHINPGSCLSYQKHDNRGELWVVKSGYGKVITNNTSRNDVDHQRDVVLKLNPLDTYQVHSGVWHQLINDSKDKPLEIMEMQYGKSISELDIVSEGYK